MNFICPICRRTLDGLACAHCDVNYREVDGILRFADEDQLLSSRHFFWGGTAVDSILSKRVLSELRRLTASSEVAVELGCGCGSLMRTLVETVPEVYGIDLDLSQLEYAQTYVPQAKLLFCDVNRTPFPEASVDLVCCTQVIEHVDDSACLSEIHRILKVSGSLILGTVVNRSGATNPTHLREYSSPGELSQLLTDNDLIPYIIDMVPVRYPLIDVLRYLPPLHSVGFGRSLNPA